MIGNLGGRRVGRLPRTFAMMPIQLSAGHRPSRPSLWSLVRLLPTKMTKISAMLIQRSTMGNRRFMAAGTDDDVVAAGVTHQNGKVPHGFMAVQIFPCPIRPLHENVTACFENTATNYRPPIERSVDKDPTFLCGRISNLVMLAALWAEHIGRNVIVLPPTHGLDYKRFEGKRNVPDGYWPAKGSQESVSGWVLLLSRKRSFARRDKSNAMFGDNCVWQPSGLSECGT